MIYNEKYTLKYITPEFYGGDKWGFLIYLRLTVSAS